MKYKKDKFDLIIVPDSGLEARKATFSLKKIIFSFIFLWLFFSIILFLLIGYNIKHYQESVFLNQESINQSLRRQIEDLNPTDIDLTTFLLYLENKRLELNNTEKRINELRQEQEQLEPLVKTNQDIINKILEQNAIYQFDLSKRTWWKDLSIHFIVGICSSIISGIIIYLYFENKVKKSMINNP